MRTQPHTRPRRCQDDGGSIIVESAIVLPLLLAMLAGLVDFGGALKNRITIQGATRAAARAEAVMGNAAAADQFTLTTLWAGMQATGNINLSKVIVFKTDLNGVLPTACASAVPSNSGNGVNSGVVRCNVYTKTQVQNSSTTFTQANAGCTSGWDRWYCPSTRQINLTGPPDYIAVYVEVVYTPYTKIFKSSITMTDQQVMRLEPPAA